MAAPPLVHLPDVDPVAPPSRRDLAAEEHFYNASVAPSIVGSLYSRPTPTPPLPQQASSAPGGSANTIPIISPSPGSFGSIPPAADTASFATRTVASTFTFPRGNGNTPLDGLLPNASISTLLKRNLKLVRPWGDFVNFHSFQNPHKETIRTRVGRNFRYFIHNYFFIVIGVLVLCMFIMPVLLLLVAALLLSLLYISYQGDVVHFPRSYSFSAVQVRWVTLLIFFLLFFIFLKLSVFFIFLATIIVIISHSIFYSGSRNEKSFIEQSFDDV